MATYGLVQAPISPAQAGSKTYDAPHQHRHSSHLRSPSRRHRPGCLSPLPSPGSPKSEKCTSPACVQFAKLLNDSVDWSANPCQDFDAYVCSGWRSKRKYSVSTELVVRAMSDVIKVISKDYAEDAPPTGQDFLQKVSLLYRSCDLVWRGDHDELPVIREFLLRAGVTWPRRSAQPDVRRTLISLSMEFDWPIVIHVLPLLDYIGMRIPYSFHLAIEETRLLSDSQSKQRSFEFLKSQFSADDSELDGAVTFPETKELESTFFRPLVSVVSRGPVKLLNANDLDKNSWIESLAQYNVSKHASFVSDSPVYVEKFLDLCKRHGEDRTHLFVSWMAARYVSVFANRDLVFNFYSTASPETLWYKHGGFCYGLAYNFVGDYLFAPYNAQVFLPVREDVERIVLSIRNEFASRLSSTPPFSTDTSANISWSSLDVVMNALNLTVIQSKEARQVADSLLPDMNISFVQNWHAAWKTSLSRKGVPVPRALGSQTVDFLAPYAHALDDFVLAPYVLSFPLYEPNLVDAVKYGAFGAVVAVASTQVALVRYSSDNATAQAIDKATTCVDANDWRTAVTLQDFASLDVLAGAFEKYGSRETLSIGFTAPQLVFVSWCFQKCRGHSEDLGDKCNAAVRHVAAFSSAFGCSHGDALNPQTKCSLF
ncbi:hypothetical protein MTO96_034054 [Rhipicephalus appendiculatus]